MVAVGVGVIVLMVKTLCFSSGQQNTQEQSAKGEELPQVYAEPLMPPSGILLAWTVALKVLLGLLARLWWQQRKKIQDLSQEQKREREEKEAAEAEKEKAQEAKRKLQDELRWTKIPYLPREDRCQVYADLKMSLFQPADVFLDPDTAHPALLVSEEQRSLQGIDTWQNLPENPERFCGNECVLGCESFASGRRFWEVEVGDRAQWRVGVCRENVRRKDGVKMAPKNGFWTVGLNPGNEYLVFTDRQTPLANISPPERVGVFLDYELGEVSFYNAIDGSHIFTFPHTRFSGPLRPVFMLCRNEPTPLTICPAQKAVRRCRVPDPGPDPSLETPVSPGSADGNRDSQLIVLSGRVMGSPEGPSQGTKEPPPPPPRMLQPWMVAVGVGVIVLMVKTLCFSSGQQNTQEQSAKGEEWPQVYAALAGDSFGGVT
ncbi:butyrophilin subfamily 3 member A3-like [Phyllostomus discolor]|uniref:Butyrophilin subfamily 3 member A3-like n=1 Tax=Phyllostomus discolor TaxID=89673 RepID=A0A7E6CW32_9CHIR|nr:butyrophilin subfamily 3 member A3-like [Phyllostomus discolor]